MPLRRCTPARRLRRAGALAAIAVLATAVLATAVLATALLPASVSAAPAAAATNRLLLGTVGGGLGTSYARVEAFQAAAGRTMATVRVYALWDDAFPGTLSDAVKAHRQTLVLSVKSRTSTGTVVPYRDIADAQPGSATYAQVQRWARDVTAYGAPMMFSYNHEPDVWKSDGMGTAAEYVQAWRRIVTIFRKEGVRNAEYVFVGTSPHWGRTDFRAAAPFYPGDDFVDDIAADGYNFFDCSRSGLLPWMDPRTLFEPFRQFGLQHPSKGLMIVEFGSVEDRADPARKPAWYRQLQQMLTEPGYSQFRAVAQWYDRVPGGACDWRTDTSSATQQAFRQWGQDPSVAGVMAVPPSTVRLVRVTPGSNAAVVSWAPAGPGGAPVTSYQVSVGETGQRFRVDGAQGSYRWTRPTGPARTYTFSVSATSSAGSSRPAPADPVVVRP